MQRTILKSLLFLAATACLVHEVHATVPQVVSPACGSLSVRGKYIKQNGAVWISHGVVSIAFVQPPAAQSTTGDPYYVAYQNITTQEANVFQNFAKFSADTIRFQVAQYPLDTNDARSDPAFTSTVLQTLHDARAAGFCVIISLTDQQETGQVQVPTEPGAQTLSVWKNVLAPAFANDSGVMFELFNEPEEGTDSQGWTDWTNGMQPIVNAIRALNANNILVADGENWATNLAGLPPLNDPNSASNPQIAYAVHPYFHSQTDLDGTNWNSKWEYLTATAPLLATEWTTIQPSPNNGYYCNDNPGSGHVATPQATVNLIDAFKTHAVGLAAFAADFHGSVFGSVIAAPAAGASGPYTATTYTAGSCSMSQHSNPNTGITNWGPGLTINYWYKNHTVPTQPY